MNRIIQIAGVISIASIIIVSTLVLVDAFIDMKSMNYSINNSLSEISSSISDLDTISKENLKVVFDSNIGKLEAKVNTLLQANTISFLFQIFSFALITIGGYLLIYYNRKFNLIKKNSEDITKNSLTNQTITYLLYSITLVNLIKHKKPSTKSEFLPKLRTYLLKTERLLEVGNGYIDGKLILVCLNLQEDILTKIKVLAAKGTDVNDIISSLNNVKDSLKSMSET